VPFLPARLRKHTSVRNGFFDRAESRHRQHQTFRRSECLSWVDAVEKVFWGKQTKFSRAADAFRAQRREGPLRFSEKRPRTFVSALLSVAAAEWSKNQHLRDFWLRSIFDFFDSIGQNRKSSMRAYIFRFAPESGHCAVQSARPFRANTGKCRSTNRSACLAL
jgi:hypothetical protein